MKERIYIAIDLKSFYASVECRERGLDPLTTNLVVADNSRTEKTICLAVSPSLKAHGISGRARLFQVVQRVREVNAQRALEFGRPLVGASSDAAEIQSNAGLAVDYIVAVPRMAMYMEYSNRIYDIYLQFVAPEDIHVYSVDEVFMDVTDYLKAYGGTPREMAMDMIRRVLAETGITATAGIGTNLYLAKVAMDIVAKHIPADENGVRIAVLDEKSYRRKLWNHRPLIDFWRVGKGYVRKLEKVGLYTMGDIARCSLGGEHEFYNEDLLYRMFGVNAELLIDHAWGYEPCTMEDIKAYRPQSNSIGSGQVLHMPYTVEKGRIIVREMVDLLVLDLVRKGMVTDQIVLTVGYDVTCLSDPSIRRKYHGPITSDHYGQSMPKAAHGTANLGEMTSSTRKITDAVMALYDRIINPVLLVRRVFVTAGHIRPEAEVRQEKSADGFQQLDFFTDYQALEAKQKEEDQENEQEKKVQQAILDIKDKFGKNAILKGTNLEEGATTIARNKQIGGHKA